MTLTGTERFFTFVLFLFGSVMFGFDKKLFGAYSIVLNSIAIIWSGSLSISNHVNYFDRGAFQFANLCLMFTAISFILKKEQAYAQLCVNMLISALLLHEEVNIHIVYLFVITGIVALSKEDGYIATMFLAISITMVSEIYLDKYVLSLIIAIPVILLTVLNYYYPYAYEKVEDARSPV